MFIQWKIERTPYVGGKYQTGDTEVLTGFFGVSVRVSLGSKKDSFQFNLTNTYNQWSDYFNRSDKITIYRKQNSTSFTNDDIIMVGVVGQILENRNSKQAVLTIKGYNYTEAVLGAIITEDPKGAGLRVAEALERGIEAINGDSPETFPITWYSGNPTLKKDGITAFPLVDEQWFNIPYIQKIEKYSQNQYTEDGTYMYWVDKDNELHWQPKTLTVDHSFDSTTEYYHMVKPDVDSQDVINYVITQGGSDPRGSPIEEIYVDEASKARYGPKYYFDDSEGNFAQSVNAQEIFDLGGNEEDVLPSQISGFSYPFTPSWSGSSVANDGEYVASLRLYVSGVLLKKAQDMVELRRFGRQMFDYTFSAGDKTWGIGDLISLTYYSASVGGNITKSLRVIDVQFTTTTDVFQLKEDTGTI